jgi:type I restriction enzyme R subunit
MYINRIVESDYENLMIDLLTEYGYEYVHGFDISVDGSESERACNEDVILEDRLIGKMIDINPGIDRSIILDAFKKLQSIQSNSLIEANYAFHEMLVNGITVEYKRHDGTIAGVPIKLIDFDNPGTNNFLAVNQLTVSNEKKKRRPDMVLFINGLPLVVVELKNPVDEKAGINKAYVQIKNYMAEIPQLFYYNELCILSDGVFTEAGTVSSDIQRFMGWKTLDGREEAPPEMGSLEVMVAGLLNKDTLLDVIKNFIVFDGDGRGNKIKKVAASHQYYATNAIVESTVKASGIAGDGRSGVVWHTQGSGKSLTMVFYSGKIAKDSRMNNPTIIVLTDRIDLDDQLFSTFSNCNHLLRQTPQQADTRQELMELLTVASGGIIFTTINKFFPGEGQVKYPVLTERHNVVVIVDEAHRSQYALIDGYASHMRDALPNASYVAFTGTPIDLSDRSTLRVFGPCISVYDIQQSIDDNTTVPIFYESRLVKIDLPDEKKELLNEAFDEIFEDSENDQKEKEKRKWSMLEALVGADKRLELVAKDIVQHYEGRQESLDGKAMIVCMSRRICIGLYDELIRLRPEWAGTGDDDSTVNVIMTGSATDPSEWQKHIRNKAARSEMAIRYKDVKDPFKIVIVRDMWLTGFDAPCMHTMYVDKPMRDHGLMQAISRVNRVFGDKPGGLIVDYIGIADNLAKAVGRYTRGGGKGKIYIDTSEAIPVFFEKYEICCNMMHGYDWSWWRNKSRKDRIRMIPGAANHILGLEDGKERFKKNVRDLERIYPQVASYAEVMAVKEDVAFFQSVRAFIVKSTESPKTKGLRDEALRQLLSSALVSEEPTDVLEILGYDKADISILSDEFLSRIKAMPEKDLAARILEKIIKDNLRVMGRGNIVQSKKFSELIEESITKYEKHLYDTTEFINALIQLAKEIKEADSRGEELGLTSDELAFYDALSTDGAAVELMGDGILRSIAMDVARTVNRNMTVDWSIREQAKAKMRIAIKRLLTKYGYPPDKKEDATQLILTQAEALCRLKEVGDYD